MTRLVISSLGFLLAFSCTQKQDQTIALSKEPYEGFWASTQIVYTFKKDGSFTFETDGHYGSVKNEGTYAILDSVLLLNPTTDAQLYHGVLKTRLKLMPDGCLRDYNNYHYCHSIELINESNRRINEFSNQAIKVLDTFTVIHRLKKQYNPEIGDEPPSFSYEGILLVDAQEYHVFDLGVYNDNDYPFYRRLGTYLVDPKTMIPYQLQSADSLIQMHP